MTDTTITRRAFLERLGHTSLVITASGWWGCGGTDDGETSGCVTPSDVEGPFYTPDAPIRAALAAPEDVGERITVIGQILDSADCATPLPGYVLDLWHADTAGNYDNEGFTLRGRFVTDEAGRFSVETVLPGLYPDRPVRHIHVKVWSTTGDERLTTQIYFDEDLSGEFTGPRAPLNSGVAEVLFIVAA